VPRGERCREGPDDQVARARGRRLATTMLAQLFLVVDRGSNPRGVRNRNPIPPGRRG
jgi:hypothetical protein